MDSTFIHNMDRYIKFKFYFEAILIFKEKNKIIYDGVARCRSSYLSHAKRALYQVSYNPEVSPGFEPGLLDSKSRVITVTPRDRDSSGIRTHEAYST
jgi:hypothetical protein